MANADFEGPVNIGSDQMVTINELVALAKIAANKNFTVRHIDGPTGVRGRNSDNRLIKKMLGWCPEMELEDGIAVTYQWILSRLASGE